MFRLHRRVPLVLLAAALSLLPAMVAPPNLYAQTDAGAPAPRLVVFEAFMRAT